VNYGSAQIADLTSNIPKLEIGNVPRVMNQFGSLQPLSGTMKCSVCDTGFIGDKGIYRCNAKSKPGMKCDNNGISQLNVEDALFTFINKMVLNFKNISAVIERIKKRLNSGKPDLSDIEKQLARIEKERQKAMNLYPTPNPKGSMIHGRHNGVSLNFQA
jgi:hypothetical protein